MTCLKKVYSNCKILADDCERKLAVEAERKVRKSKPTHEQEHEVLCVVRDFGYRDKVVPKFDTYAELDAWRRQFVKSKCGC